MSEDGIGTNNPAGGPVYVQKNDPSATVQAAYLLAAGVPSYVMKNGDVTLNGTSLSFAPADSVIGNFGVNSVWTNVTSIVKPVVAAAPPGKVKFTAAEPTNTDSIDGEILAVIMSDPTLPTNNTVSFLFGALDTTGDSFSIGLASPLNLSDKNLSLTMSIGDSYSYQGPPATGQYSTISVDGTLMTSSAGGNDDSVCKYDTPPDFANCGNGELITVGGIGDSTANPPVPTATDSTCGPPGPPRCDDELYNLLPLVKNGDTSITVKTANPSNNDNIFFTGFQLDSAAAVVGEGAVLTPVAGTSPVGSPYTFTAKLQDSTGSPLADTKVTFLVLSGPNAGKTATATTNGSGDATFTYTSSTAGTDTVQASFTDSSDDKTVTSNEATVDWVGAVKTATTVTTSLSGGGHSGTTISVPPSTPVTDASTLTGPNAATATGTVTYDVYSNSNCTTAVSSGVPETITKAGALPASSPVTLTSPGTYYWQASYSGDTKNMASKSTCGTTGEIETVPPTTPTSISTLLYVGSGGSCTNNSNWQCGGHGGGGWGHHGGGGWGHHGGHGYDKTKAKTASTKTTKTKSKSKSKAETKACGNWNGGNWGGGGSWGGGSGGCGGGSHGSTSVTVVSGTAVTDSATLSGANTSSATGTVTYDVYANSTCSGTPAASGGTVDVALGKVPSSGPVTIKVPGTYYWQASYSGDAKNSPSLSTCGGEVEKVTPTPTEITTLLSGGATFGGHWCWWQGHGITVYAGTPVTDSATLSGVNASSAGGTVTYTVYGAYQSGGSWKYGKVASGGTVRVSGGVVPNSDPVTLGPGDYTWQASYSGDALNAASTSQWGSETENVVPVPSCPHGWSGGQNGGCSSQGGHGGGGWHGRGGNGGGWNGNGHGHGRQGSKKATTKARTKAGKAT